VDEAPARQSVRILVVDDDADHRATLCTVLEESGYRVDGAHQGQAALDRMLAGELPDLILLDLCMPVMDGWAFSAALKEHPHLARIPVVVMSGRGEGALSAAPVSAGYLLKPLDLKQVLEIISTCLWRYERRNKARVADDGEREAAPAEARRNPGRRRTPSGGFDLSQDGVDSSPADGHRAS